MTILNWAEYEEEETPAERSFWREVACALLIGVTLAAILSSIGCATVSPSPRTEVCILQLLGQTSDSGLPVVATTCVSPEQFAESQK